MRRGAIFYTVACILVFLLFAGLAWLVLGLLFYIGLIFLSRLDLPWIRYIRSRQVLSGPLILFALFFSTICFRVFIAEIYHVPSGSMEESLLDGDNILMCKLNYGPKLPGSAAEIPWAGLFYFLSRHVSDSDRTGKPSSRRLSGFSSLHRGDIVVFRMPETSNSPLVKRCAGQPGDRVLITDGRVVINGDTVRPVSTTKYFYKMRFSDMDDFTDLMERLDINFYFDGGDKACAYGYFSLRLCDSLRHAKCISSVERALMSYNGSPCVYPWDTSYKWTIDNYGPILVPSKGMKIVLNRLNYVLYKNIFDHYEHVSMRGTDGRFYSDEGEIREYVFRNDYCFTLGDNWNDSDDSRYWGFLPMQNVEGKAICILFSNAHRHFNWDRILRWL